MELINNLSHYQIINSIAWTLFHSVWQGLILLVPIYLLAQISKNSLFRYWLYSSFFLILPVLSVVTFLNLSDTIETGLSENAQILIEQSMAGTNLLAEGDYSFWSEVILKINAYSHFAVVLWFVGIVFISLKTMTGLLLISYAKHNGNHVFPENYKSILFRFEAKGYRFEAPRIVESVYCKIPMIAGVLKPVILFPLGMINNLPNHYIEAVISHELFHLVRRDNVFIYIQKLLETIYFFNPSVLFISGLINREREIICDELAINLPLNKKTYAKALAFFSENTINPGYTFAALYNGKNQLYHRIQRILGVTMKNDYSGIKLMISILIVSAGLIFAASPEFTFNSIGTDTLRTLPEPPRVEELPPLSGIAPREPEVNFEIPPAPEVNELPPTPPLPPVKTDSVKKVVSFEEIAGIPYRNVRIETDENYNVIRFSIDGKIIPKEDYNQYGDLFKKAFKHHDELELSLEKSMDDLHDSMGGLKESMDKLKEMSEIMREDEIELRKEAIEMEKETKSHEVEAKEMEKEAEIMAQQARELESKSKALEQEAVKNKQVADAHELVYKEMIKDGLLKSGEPMHILFTKTELFINEVKQPDSVHEKYLNLYIKYFGEEFVNKAIEMQINKD